MTSDPPAPASAYRTDKPTTEDRLDFKFYVRRLATTIRNAAERDQLPLAIGVFGRWGSGKTSLMRMVEEQLNPPPIPLSAEHLRRLMRHQRWLFGYYALWEALLLAGLLLARLIALALFGLSNWSAGTFFWIVLVLAGVGGWAAALYAWWRHLLAERDYDFAFLIWYLLRPAQSLIVGAFLGSLVWLLTPSQIQPAGRAATILFILAVVLGAAWTQLLAVVRSAPEWLGRRLARRDKTAKFAPAPAASRSPVCQVIWFNAWKYAKENELWAALLQQILSQLTLTGDTRQRLVKKYRLWKRSIEWHSGARDVARKLWPTAGRALAIAGSTAAVAFVVHWLATGAGYFTPEVQRAISTAAGTLTFLLTAGSWVNTNIAQPLADVDFESYKKKASYKDYLTFLAEFSKEFAEIARIARDAGNPIVLMIDDLDRCLPDQAVSVLEAIKLFIGDDAPVAFLIGADREFIERAVEVKYASLVKDDPDPARRERFTAMGREYLEKIIQVPFNLPPIEEKKVNVFIDQTFADDPLVEKHSEIFAAGLERNPRQIIRAIGIYRFLVGLANERADIFTKWIDPAILAKLVVIQYRWPDLYAAIVENQTILGEIEDFFTANPPRPASEFSEAAQAFFNRRALRKLLTLVNTPSLKGAPLDRYLFFTARAEAEPPPASTASTAQTAPVTPPPGEKAVEPTPVAPVQPVPEEIEKVRQRIDRLEKEAHAPGVDTAIATRLLESLTRSREMLSADPAGNLPVVLQQLDEAEGMLSQARQPQREEDLSAQRVQVEVGKGGRLVFQRAVNYEDFLLRAELTAPDTLAVRWSWRGYISTGDWEFQFSPPEWAEQLAALRQTTPPDLIQSIGGRLFKEMIGLDRVQREVGEIVGPTRLRLVLRDRELDSWPWELLYGDEYLGLSPGWTIARDTPSPSPKTTWPANRVSPPVRMLLAYASPAQLPPLEASFNAVRSALSPLVEAGSLQIVTLEHATPTTLRELIGKNLPDIVHLMSRVTETSAAGPSLVLEDADGNLEPVDMRALQSALLWGKGTTPYGLIHLDANASVGLVRDVAANVPVGSIVAWRGEYIERSSPIFARAFYEALFRTGQADYAMAEARRALAAEFGVHPPEWSKPAMYLNAEDGVVFTS